METIETNKNKIIIKEKINESLINAIRRYVNEIPVLAIDEVEISKNDSALYDETLAHRMGLIPIISKKINEKTSGELTLDIKKEGIVYSGDLQGNINLVYDNIPITLLNKGQEIKLIAKVKAGKGSEHSKFSPGILFYRNVVDIKINNDCPEEVIKMCPLSVFELKENKVLAKHSEKCDMCNVCLEICSKYKKDSITITPKDELIITIESFGQMDVKDIFTNSVSILKKDLEDIEKSL